MYSEKLMERFRNPKFVGKIKYPDGVGEEGNMRCGDIMKLYIKVKDNKIMDAKFETFGCAAAIATSDALCELAIGKTLGEALKIKKEDIIKLLGGDVPKIKYHCSVLGVETLHKAIEDYKKKHKSF
ncbi:MAG: iron-sulfur cluster assembly scaffold protein [Candidatus Nanoarchaeia archaeon]|nr:iron-sulfur cluster assembly scaffold protein [Candidatus Nanoarchaeia archaeon]